MAGWSRGQSRDRARAAIALLLSTISEAGLWRCRTWIGASLLANAEHLAKNIGIFGPEVLREGFEAGHVVHFGDPDRTAGGHHCIMSSATQHRPDGAMEVVESG